MTSMIRKNRFSLAAVLLLLLGGFSMGVFPGWVKPVYGTPGAPCSLNFPLACDVCNSETCVPPNIIAGGTNGICINGNGSSNPDATPTPACPGNQDFPGCWTTCTENPIGDGFEDAVCSPNDSFCSNISGGDGANECRIGVCTDNGLFDQNNPSGCDYSLNADAGEECRNCLPAEQAPTNCGNGICESGIGESCENCAVDCLIPGFEEVCPLTSGIVIRQACQPITPQITFSGPPYNVPGSIECEDGDLCTENSCSPTAGDVCDATPKSCSFNVGDFCCPSGCSAPSDSSQCGQTDENCDIDCYVPVDCVPTPAPTPPPPVLPTCLQGSGLSGEKGGPGCGGFACSLNTAKTVPSHGIALALLASLGMVGFFSLRKRHG